MCMGKSECQTCETCGLRKWQFWVAEEMHPRGCPFGFSRMDQCPDAANYAKLLRWAIDGDVNVSPEGRALVSQMEWSGVDLYGPQVKCEDYAP